MIAGAPGLPLHLFWVNTPGKGLHHDLELSEGGEPAHPNLLHCIATPQIQRSGILAGHAMVVGSTWNRTRPAGQLLAQASRAA